MKIERGFVADETVGRVLGAAFAVSNELGGGFLERVYQEALRVELSLRGVAIEREVEFPVVYRGRVVGKYRADLVAEGRVIVELKCVECFHEAHLAQALNYLRVSGLELALLINFAQPRLEYRRVVLRSTA